MAAFTLSATLAGHSQDVSTSQARGFRILTLAHPPGPFALRRILRHHHLRISRFDSHRMERIEEYRQEVGKFAHNQ